MDSYTENVQEWLDKRFRETDSDGVYFAHQPIYGFRAGHSEDGVMQRYLITHQILNALAKLKFRTFLDIGGAEGYKSGLVRKVFGVEVTSCDLSIEATHRAKQIFDVDGESVDIVNLPFAASSFDVVCCSETLEHVPDIEAATRELMRVCKGAVLITVPKESPSDVERNIREKLPHAHIQALDLDSFNWVKDEGFSVIQRRLAARGIVNTLIKLINAQERHKSTWSRTRTAFQNRVIAPSLRMAFGRLSACLAIRLDDWVSKRTNRAQGLLFILVKDPTVLKEASSVTAIPPTAILDFTVPLFHISQYDK